MQLLLSPKKHHELTVSLFGKLLCLVWAEKHGRSPLPTNEELNRLLLSDGDIPDRVKSIMHLDADSVEPAVRELTEYIFAAQKAGLISRDNPSYIAGTIQIGAFDARKLLGEYEGDLGDVVDWLRKHVDQ